MRQMIDFAGPIDNRWRYMKLSILPILAMTTMMISLQFEKCIASKYFPTTVVFSSLSTKLNFSWGRQLNFPDKTFQNRNKIIRTGTGSGNHLKVFNHIFFSIKSWKEGMGCCGGLYLFWSGQKKVATENREGLCESLDV